MINKVKVMIKKSILIHNNPIHKKLTPMKDQMNCWKKRKKSLSKKKKKLNKKNMMKKLPMR